MAELLARGWVHPLTWGGRVGVDTHSYHWTCLCANVLTGRFFHCFPHTLLSLSIMIFPHNLPNGEAIFPVFLLLCLCFSISPFLRRTVTVDRGWWWDDGHKYRRVEGAFHGMGVSLVTCGNALEMAETVGSCPVSRGCKRAMRLCPAAHPGCECCAHWSDTYAYTDAQIHGGSYLYDCVVYQLS